MSTQLSYLGDPALHFWLTRSVARAMDLSLSEAMASGKLTATGYADMVTRCRQCPHVGACQSWLATCGARAQEAPEQCINKGILDALH